MAKVLLVEDDTNLREIFEMRLQAEGYSTITAGNGEEALVVAMKEKPDLIIADVMMPRLSGFEMLETLRAAPGMSNTKVIMMTALGQAEDQARGEKLGVVKYLVKSQVTLEDFARVVREVLPPEGGNQKTKQESEQKMPDDNQTNPQPTQPPADDAATNNPISGGPADGAATTDQPTTEAEQGAVDEQVKNFEQTPAEPAAAPGPEAAPDAGSTPEAPGETGQPPAADGQNSL